MLSSVSGVRASPPAGLIEAQAVEAGRHPDGERTGRSTRSSVVSLGWVKFSIVQGVSRRNRLEGG